VLGGKIVMFEHDSLLPQYSQVRRSAPVYSGVRVKTLSVKIFNFMRDQ
jgi:hypothetical protein